MSLSGGDWFSELSEIVGDLELYDILTQLDHDGRSSVGQGLGLSEEEIATVHAYTMSDQLDGRCCFRAVNSALRAGKTDKMASVLSALIDGVKKLPRYEGIVVRMTDLPPEILDIPEGALFADRAFMSTSRDVDPARRMHFGIDHLSLNSTTGRDISMISAFPKEREVLFMPGTQFRMSSIRRNRVMGYSLVADEDDGQEH